MPLFPTKSFEQHPPTQFCPQRKIRRLSGKHRKSAICVEVLPESPWLLSNKKFCKLGEYMERVKPL